MIADTLDLIHRLPRTWAVVQAGDCEPLVARRVAVMTRPLLADTVGIVDRAVAKAIAGHAPTTVFAIARAKTIEADPETHAAERERIRHERYVRLSRADEFGYRHLIARITAGDATWIDAMTDRVADILARTHGHDHNHHELRTDAYEHPEPVKDHIWTQSGGDVFPYSPRTATRTEVDFDHSTAYDPTRPDRTPQQRPPTTPTPPLEDPRRLPLPHHQPRPPPLADPPRTQLPRRPRRHPTPRRHRGRPHPHRTRRRRDLPATGPAGPRRLTPRRDQDPARDRDPARRSARLRWSPIPMHPSPTEPSDPGTRRLLLVVDAPSLLHRNHHARAHTRIKDRAGRPVWALHGMLRQILESIDQFAPDAVIFGLDDRTGSERRDFYPDYKAGRAEKDAELVEQLERAGALLDALGLATLTPPGLEADDVNASGATWATAHDWNCVIITSDRDAFAHISDHTQVLRLINGGINGSPLLNPARLHAMYGVPAHHYLEYAALRGDTSDNLPGVTGIGEKAAAALLLTAGSMDAVWADIDHDEGRSLVAALDALATETGGRRTGAGVVRRLAAPGARERYDFNVRMMSGRDDLDLGLTPDVPGTPGLLPLDIDRVSRVVGFLGVEATTSLAVRVLTGDPASRSAAR